MLLKLCGCIAFTLAGLTAGLLRSKSLYARRQFLRSFMVFLQTLATMLRYRAEDIFTLVQSASKSASLQSAQPEEHLDFAQWWLRQTEAMQPPNALQNSDKELLSAFGSQLGASDTEGQLRHIELYQTLFAKQLKQAEETLAQKSRLYRTLGLFGGLSVGIVLL
ncbi:MAG: stage III sporulation protein AB [Ruminococcus sp.]|nr:stage III sporulation protein AB [Ruminococcus sp.]